MFNFSRQKLFAQKLRISSDVAKIVKEFGNHEYIHLSVENVYKRILKPKRPKCWLHFVCIIPNTVLLLYILFKVSIERYRLPYSV